jgi:hypothetical protein
MFEEAVRQLRHIQPQCEKSHEIKNILDARDTVRSRYQGMFSAENIPQLSERDFKGFLLFENNKHWTSLHRQGGRICQDMDGLRRTLQALHDNSIPIDDRWNSAIKIKHLGPAILSAMLHIMRPDMYGVWNRISEEILDRLNILPRLPIGFNQRTTLQTN